MNKRSDLPDMAAVLERSKQREHERIANLPLPEAEHHEMLARAINEEAE